ncbi:hypothetical protein [Kribbella sp. NPDC049584]|uniref:hypothetical protein n=1 Tax=Kribbella sp. NPDC049584 TaxID=3154833 RepID=UPI003437DDD5
MKGRTLSAIVSLPMLVASLVGTSAAASATTAGTAASHSTVATAAAPDAAPDQVLGFWYTAQWDYFYSFNSCQAYGYMATGGRSGNGTVPGTTNWSCYVNSGQTKYSIDLYMEG